VVITQSTAHEIFGDGDPIGQKLAIENKYLGGEYEITGIVQDLADNTILRFDMLTCTVQASSPPGQAKIAWESTRPFETFVKLREGVPASIIEQKMQSLLAQHLEKTIADRSSYHLQPLTSIYLHSSADYGIASSMGVAYGDGKIVATIGIIAALIFVVACVHYVNFSLAQTLGRAKETAIREVVGARFTQIACQLTLESILVTGLAALLAISISQLSLPYVNTLLGKQLVLNYSSASILLLITVITVGTIAGLYPALVLSLTQPLSRIKGQGFRPSKTKLGFCMLSLQFGISCALVLVTGAIGHQLDYILNKDIGFDRDQILLLPIFAGEGESKARFEDRLASRYNTVKQAFLTHPDVVSASAFRFGITEPGWSGGGGKERRVQPEGASDENWRMWIQEADEDYLSTYGIDIVKGRNFSIAHGTDAYRAFILNETAVRRLGWDAPIGKSFKWEGVREGEVIGVVKDYHHRSLKAPIEPLAITIKPHLFRHLALKVRPNNLESLLPFLGQTWRQFRPDIPFSYSFEDENFRALYHQERSTSRIIAISSAVAILIACFGLFGLSSYAVATRTKEIGIRKAVGASKTQIVWMFYTEFLKPVVCGVVVAIPVSYFVSNAWIEGFAYRTGLHANSFVAGVAVVISVALLTVTFNTLKAASADPVKSLRDE